MPYETKKIDEFYQKLINSERKLFQHVLPVYDQLPKDAFTFTLRDIRENKLTRSSNITYKTILRPDTPDEVIRNFVKNAVVYQYNETTYSMFSERHEDWILEVQQGHITIRHTIEVLVDDKDPLFSKDNYITIENGEAYGVTYNLEQYEGSIEAQDVEALFHQFLVIFECDTKELLDQEDVIQYLFNKNASISNWILKLYSTNCLREKPQFLATKCDYLGRNSKSFITYKTHKINEFYQKLINSERKLCQHVHFVYKELPNDAFTFTLKNIKEKGVNRRSNITYKTILRPDTPDEVVPNVVKSAVVYQYNETTYNMFTEKQEDWLLEVQEGKFTIQHTIELLVNDKDPLFSKDTYITIENGEAFGVKYNLGQYEGSIEAQDLEALFHQFLVVFECDTKELLDQKDIIQYLFNKRLASSNNSLLQFNSMSILNTSLFFINNTSQSFATQVYDTWLDYSNEFCSSKFKLRYLRSLLYAFNISERFIRQSNVIQLDRMVTFLISKSHKHYKTNFGYILGKAPYLVPNRMMEEKTDWTENIYIRDAIKNLEILDVTKDSLKADAEEGIAIKPFAIPFTVQIYNGLFYKNGIIFDTTSMVAHLKPEYAAFTLNIDGDFYLFDHDFGKNKLKHTSMSGGKPVIMAGEMKIKGGFLKSITTQSGHYRPKIFNIYRFLQYLTRFGMEISQSDVIVFDRPPAELNLSVTEIDVPAKQVKNRKRFQIPATDIYYGTDISLQKLPKEKEFIGLISDMKLSPSSDQSEQALTIAFEKELALFKSLILYKMTPCEFLWIIHELKTLLKKYETQHMMLLCQTSSATVEESKQSLPEIKQTHSSFNFFIQQLKKFKKDLMVLDQSPRLELMKTV